MVASVPPSSGVPASAGLTIASFVATSAAAPLEPSAEPVDEASGEPSIGRTHPEASMAARPATRAKPLHRATQLELSHVVPIRPPALCKVDENVHFAPWRGGLRPLSLRKSEIATKVFCPQ
jgi:hypothetical protein